jgi:hypothetical protein
MNRRFPLHLARAACALATLAVVSVPAVAQRQPNSAFHRLRAGAEHTLLLPDGWLREGGVSRLPADGPAPFAFIARADETAQVELRLLPGRPGSGAIDAVGLLARTVAPRLRPAAVNLRVVAQERLPALAPRGDAAAVTVEYDEGGIAFRERLLAVLESTEGAEGAWRARELIAARAPAAEWERWAPVFGLMLASGAPATGPFAPEIRRALGFALPKENSWTNPFGGADEIGSFWFGRYRWETPDGDVVCSFNETYNPNAGKLLGRDDWRKCKPL